MNNSPILLPPQPPKTCLYCGNATGKVKKGEHVIPAAIGGVRTIKNVCAACNNTVLSDLDKELCTNSPLGLAAIEAMSKRPQFTWDVDHQAGNLLMEAHPLIDQQSMMLWPQLILDTRGPEFRADYEEMASFGFQRFQTVFIRRLRMAFANWKRTRNGLSFVPLNADESILNRYRYPPRVFAQRRLADLYNATTFHVAYHSQSDKRRMLSLLDNWDDTTLFNSSGKQLGSYLPVVRRYWDPIKIMRALAKIAINLISDTCERTRVNASTFPVAISFVMGKSGDQSPMLRHIGFVPPAEIATIHSDGFGHSFRIHFDRGTWTAYSSFFGGRVCAVARLPGVSNEVWTSCDISAEVRSSGSPTTSSDWSVVKSSLLRPMNVRIEFNKPDRIIPHLGLINNQTFLDVRLQEKRW